MLARLGLAARALGADGSWGASAASAFRAAFAHFPTGGEFMTRLLIRLVLDLVAADACQEELAEILWEDARKSRSIAPLGAALSARAGEPVRAHAEVLEVAADVRRALDEVSEKGALRAS